MRSDIIYFLSNAQDNTINAELKDTNKVKSFGAGYYLVFINEGIIVELIYHFSMTQ